MIPTVPAAAPVPDAGSGRAAGLLDVINSARPTVLIGTLASIVTPAAPIASMS